MKKNEVLSKIQSELVAPKGQFNDFGKYKYRSCEDILEALKPLLNKYGATLRITDEVVLIGTRYYIKARVSLISEDGEIIVEALAREAENKKGMDEAQITGAASSYARKYALSGLFCIDDTKDADALPANGNGYITEKQTSELLDMITEYKVDVKKFCKAYNIEEVSKLPKNRFQDAFAALMGKKSKVAK